MVLRIIMGLLVAGAAISISGCAHRKADLSGDDKVRTFAENYRHSKEARRVDEEERQSTKVSLSADTGYVKPYLPLVLPPHVIKVWVPAHVGVQDKEVLVAGHWSFVMLEKANWYIEHEISDRLSIPVIMPSPQQKEE